MEDDEILVEGMEKENVCFCHLFATKGIWRRQRIGWLSFSLKWILWKSWQWPNEPTTTATQTHTKIKRTKRVRRKKEKQDAKKKLTHKKKLCFVFCSKQVHKIIVPIL